MMTMELFPVLLTAILLVTGTIANPLEDPYICGSPKCKGQGKFKYGPSTQQNYKYSVEVRSMFNGTSKNESTLYVEGTARLAFLTPCDGLLTFSDIKLSENIPEDGWQSPEHSNGQLFADMITAYSLRFSFKDGIIAELCPKEEEKEWVLNFKRGLLNMLHNSMKRFDLDYSSEDEEDIRGKCPTTYRVIGAKETSLLIEKNKDLDSCAGKSRLHSIIQTTPVPNFKPNVRSDNILKSTSQCLYSIDHNIYNDITCKETYLLQPFSNQGAGASTSVIQRLVLTEETSGTVNEEGEITRRLPLNFDHAIISKPTHDNTDVSKELIRSLCEQSKVQDRTLLSNLFTKCIHNLRLLSYDALKQLYADTRSLCPAGKKYFLDALPFLNNAAAVGLIADIISEKSIPESKADELMLSIAFIPRPDDDVMEAALRLLEGKNFTSNIALSVSSLTHTYCRDRSNCESTYAVYSIVSLLENHFLDLYGKSSIDAKTHDSIMVTLKALSNIGIITQQFQTVLFEVIQNPNLDVAIRVSAVETFRRMPCEHTSYFEHLYRNQEGDAEVRIAAYLQIMRCPNYLVIRTVRHSLMEEEVNQVGSFVWTHLSNLIKTSVPSKVEIQSLLSEKDLVNKFSTDVRKFSRNFEGSMYFDEYNMGGSYESNIIFSTSSYIPRSATLNLTVDLFGESVNILELYGRADGFEHYFESFFGPKGSLRTMKDNIMDKIRFPRSVKNSDLIKSQVEDLNNVMEEEGVEPKIALGLKIFGNDLKYASWNGEQEIRSAVETMDPVYHLKRILSGKEINYSKASMFLDSKYVVATGAGLPLSLTTTGTSYVNIKLYGSLGSAGFSKDKEFKMDLTANIQPTVSLDVTGEMSVDVFYASAGIKLKTTMYSDTAVEGDIKIRGTRLASVKFGLPRQKNEIFSASSELLVKKNDVEDAQAGLTSNRFSKSICSWPVVDQTVGLKLCSDYNFVNVTKLDNIPYFLVAGPAGFRCYLQKSDPTANVYLLEYKWLQHKESSVVSLTFDTPGSAVKRLVGANLTIDRQSQNLTLLLQSSAGTVLARGKYKNTPDEKFAQVALDINDKKHFDAKVSWARKRIKNGYSYTPMVYLGVNEERVLQFSGYVDEMSKRGVSQYTVDLTFETKRLRSRLYGYVSKTGSSLEASLFNDYKFHHTQEQRVALKFGAANRSRKNMVVFIAFCNLNSTAYPNMNVAANATFQKGGSHMDLTINLVQNPRRADDPEADYHTLRFDMIFSFKSFSDNKRIFKAVSSLSRKSTNLALKGELIYETYRHDVNLAALVKYGNNKEVSVTIFWSHPRTTLEQIRAHLNITIPSFTPMILKVEIEEQLPRDYVIDLKATWFSGHSVTAVGFYQDKCTSLSSDHHLKFLLKSPSFKDINIDALFYRDNDTLQLDFKGLYNNSDDYQLYFHHQIKSEEETDLQAKIKYKTKVGSFNGSIYDGDYKKINAELHIDQIRDVVFSLYLLNKDDDKAIGFEINWDANRDPSQKLIISGSYRKNAPFNYLAGFKVIYPGKYIKGDYKFILEERHLSTLASISWDGGTFGANVDVAYEYEKRWYLKFSSQLFTPFDNWKLMKLEGTFEHQKNKYDLHGVMSWDKRQRVAVDVFGDYTSDGSRFTCKYSCSIASSIDRVPNINTTISHNQNKTNFDSVLYLMYNPDFVIDVDSQWRVDTGPTSTNLTGTVHSKTPFKGLNSGLLVSKIFLKGRRYMRGAAQLDVDHKKINIDAEGKFHKLTNCMLIVNMTAPEDEYQLRFIISAEKRQFVVMFDYPNGSVGADVLLSANSITNFDVKLHLATPVEFLQDVIIAAKLKPEQADFRLGWNFLLLGFSGVWHYANVTDFEYSYKIYTPIEDFEENGVVGKLLYKEGLDFEASVKLSMYKLGVKLMGHSNPKHFKGLGIDMKNVYLGSTLSQVGKTNGEEPLSWKGLVELDIIMYPTMKGQMEIDQKGETYILQSKLTMPNGDAHILDEFFYKDIFSMKNNLQIETPYNICKTITSQFALDIKKDHIYLFHIDLNYLNDTRLIESGVYGKYIVQTRGSEERIYNVTLKVNTPFKAFPKLNLFGAFETEENFYRTKLLFNTNRSDISLDATTEFDHELMEIISSIHAKTPSIYIPHTQLRLAKLMSPGKNYIEIDMNVPEKLRSSIYMRIYWLFKSREQFYTNFQLETPFAGLENTTAGIDVDISNVRSTLWAAIQLSPLEIEINSSLDKDLLKAKSDLVFNGKRFPLIVNCYIRTPSKNHKEYDGYLTLSGNRFNISGNADVIGLLPTRLELLFTPTDGTAPMTINYQIMSEAFQRYKFNGRIQYATRYAQLDGQLNATDEFNWKVHSQVSTSNDERFIADVAALSDGKSVNLIVDAQTPIPQLENPKLGATYTTKELKKLINGYFIVTNAKGSLDIELIWQFMENMYVKGVGAFSNTQYASESVLQAFYENPQQLFQYFRVGADARLDHLWEAGTNVTVKLPLNDSIDLETHFKFPDEMKEVHSLYANLDYIKSYRNFGYLLKYRTLQSQKKYGSWGQISSEDKQNCSGKIEVEWNGKRFSNFGNLKMSDEHLNLIYKLKTPKFTDKQFLVGEINYKAHGDSHNITCRAYYPENQLVAYTTVDYKELANMNGMCNITVPYKALKYCGAYFNTESSAAVYNRYIKVFWHDDNAILDGKCDIKPGQTLGDRNMKGKLIIELPLATRHIALVDYEYDKNGKVSVGNAAINYNGSRVLVGRYNCVSESNTDRDKDTIHVEIQNNMVPVGADYIRVQDYSTSMAANIAPSMENKFLHLYHLQNRSRFNVTGELNIQTTSTGQRYILTAVHSNRTVKIWTDYDVFEREYRQHSRVQLSPAHWIEYDINLLNMTVDEIFDAQQVAVNVIYPRRSFTARGSYNISDSIVSTDVSLVWDKDNKTVEAGFDWRRVSFNREQLLFEIKHPSFEKVVSFYSEYGYNKSSVDGQLVVDYSLDPDQKLTLGGKVNDNSNSLKYNYTYNVWAGHTATNLNLNSGGEFYWNPEAFGTQHTTNYRRSYLPVSTSEVVARIDMDNNEIELKKDNIASGLTYFWGRYGGQYPIYTANMSAVQRMNDTKGEFYVNLREKLLYLNVNMTEDGTQSLHMFGVIPDARRAVFDIWRDYDDKRVSDVSYYLQLNHSRLITSRLNWRPELITDVQAGVRGSVAQFYVDTLEGINNTKQYVKSEMLDALNGIWVDAKPSVQYFLDDLRNLTVIEEDFQELRVFLNQSYHANEFYLKSITDIIITMFDELALKSQLQNLPKIFQEIWSVMGKSGEKIKNSILWVIEKIKIYYKNATEFIHGLIHGDPIQHITAGLERLIERWDEFIKGVQITALQYMKNLWSETYKFVVEHWHKTLATLEPAFLRFVHYLETLAWSTGKELLDFLYQRKNEILESPYFFQFTKLSQDVDRFYRDLTGKNPIASLFKYCKVAWKFLKEKYLTVIPFGKELMDIVNEIIHELKQIAEIPSVKFLISKLNEVTSQAQCYYDYFDMENRIHKLISLIYTKISEMSVTALEVENRQRVAKTKFIFEPYDGLMLLEQKLPMPWHAFNETPKFKEIPEIKRVYDFFSYLKASQISFWNLYYDFKPFSDPSDWLPPFKGQAMLIGTKYYVTFDRTFYEFPGSCTYLLATDFVDQNFTLLVSYDSVGNTDELMLLLNKTVVRINILNDRILVGDLNIEKLPLQVGDVFLYRESGMFIARGERGFLLECNMKFKICTFEMSGWYFGKTAGLWGTYNNEPSDDFRTSNKSRATKALLDTFGDSWALDKNCKSEAPKLENPKSPSPEISSLCDEFFTSKVSQLSTCFSRVPKDSFLSMCLNSVSQEEACMSAISYINLCSYANTPLRIPDTCVKCNLPNGTVIQEGDFIRLQGNAVPRTADIVFIVEAKTCNKDLKNTRNFDSVIELLEKELADLNIKDNRYSLVTFGGDGAWDEPRSVIVNGEYFTDSKSVTKYFDIIQTGNGSSDVFNGIMFAYNLIFRPGAARNFVLLPCSECNKDTIEHDYSTIHQLLSESAISLHILMNDYFKMQKDRDAKIPFGIDRRYAYTKRDIRGLVGDQALRKSIILPKSTLGLCLSLAVETNGTVFCAKYLETDKKNFKKFATVFTKAVARSAVPRQCLDCECTAPNSGVSYMECYLCTTTNLTRHNFEILGLDDEDSFGNLNVFDGFNV